MTYLSTVLQSFFSTYAHTRRNLSANTITTYRDTWRLLVKRLAATTGTSPDQLRLDDLDAGAVTGFLDHCAADRGNAPATRNNRLTAIRAVLAHALPDHPEHADHIRQILALPPAKTPKPQIAYLTQPETSALLAAPDTSTWIGRRDQAMLALDINTGLRISELLSLDTASIHTAGSPFVDCEGKGRKHRSTPISKNLATQMRSYLHERTLRTGLALFPGPHGGPLSRDAAEHRLKTHVTTATRTEPSLATKHVTWHTLRHTTAMNLLHAGVDITVIALWLGHEQTTTTDIYLHADMTTKQKALDLTRPATTPAGTYTPSPDILTWLNTL